MLQESAQGKAFVGALKKRRQRSPRFAFLPFSIFFLFFFNKTISFDSHYRISVFSFMRIIQQKKKGKKKVLLYFPSESDNKGNILEKEE
jgi:hypothetical protein